MSSRTALLLCLLIALAVRLLAYYPFLGLTETHGDETYYVLVARSIAAGDGHPGSFRPPLYPFFIAGVFRLWGDDLVALRFAQIAVALIPVGVVTTLAGRRFGTRAGFVSGLTCALVPSLAHYGHFLWSESLATALLLLVFLALDRHLLTGARWGALVVGVLLGITALVREQYAPFTVIVALWLAWNTRSNWKRAATESVLVLVGAAAVILPWTVRNHALHGELVLISTCRWAPTAWGNLLPDEGDEKSGAERLRPYKQAARGLGELEAESYWRGVALEAIAAEQPWWVFKKLRWNVPKLFSLRSQVARFLRNGWLPDVDRTVANALVVTDVAGYLVTMALGLVSLWLVPGGRFKWLLLAAILSTIAVYVASLATARFLVPLMPLIVLYVGPMLSVRGAARFSPWRVIGAAATVAVFLASALSGWGGVVRLLA